MTQQENLELFKKTGKFVAGICKLKSGGWYAKLIGGRYYYEMLNINSMGNSGSMEMSDVIDAINQDKSYEGYIPEPFKLSSDVVI